MGSLTDLRCVPTSALKSLSHLNASLASLAKSFYEKQQIAQNTYTSAMTTLINESLLQLADLSSDPSFPDGCALASLLHATLQTANQDLASMQDMLDQNKQAIDAATTTIAEKQSKLAILLKEHQVLRDELDGFKLNVKKLQEANQEAVDALTTAKAQKQVSSGKRKYKLSPDTALVIRKNAHNTYVLEMEAANASHAKILDTDLPAVLEPLEEVLRAFTSETVQLVATCSTNAQTFSSRLHENQSNLASKCPTDLAGDLSKWAESAQSTASDACVKPFTFVAPNNAEEGGTPELLVEGVEVVLKAKITSLETEVTSLASLIGKKQNALHGLEKLLENYRANNSFGSPDTILSQIEEVHQDIRRIKIDMARNHAMLAVLQTVPVESVELQVGKAHSWKVCSYQKIVRCSYCQKPLTGLMRQGVRCTQCSVVVHRQCAQFLGACELSKKAKPAQDRASRKAPSRAKSIRPKNVRPASMRVPALPTTEDSESEDWEDWDDVAETEEGRKRLALALFDYKPLKDHELEIHAGDILVIEEGSPDPAWLKATLRGSETKGVVPSNYVKDFFNEDDPNSKVTSLYAYEAKNDDELSFEANVSIMLLEPDENGWSVGLCDGRLGVFPSAYVTQPQDL
eukprot:m.34673 g.34673  ORF g.34673 m.34673 type:complete len:630 (-) comp15548_c0_seq1:195-2084(-)